MVWYNPRTWGKKEEVKQEGTIYLKPSEKASAESLAKKTGATISVPKTKEVYSPKTKSFVSSGGGSGGGSSVGTSQATATQKAQITQQQKVSSVSSIETKKDLYKKAIQEKGYIKGTFD